MRARLIPAARAANALFFVVTATYCILTYSSFAYQQFIRPRLVASLAGFVTFHHLWHWVLLGVTVITLLPEWKVSRGRALSWAYVAAMSAVGLLLLYRPLLPSVENDSAGLWLACLFLLPPIVLAAYDHCATADLFRPVPADPARLVASATLAGVVVWVVNTGAVPLHVSGLGDYTATRESLAFGALVSLSVHIGLFAAGGTVVAVLLQSVARLRKATILQYWLLAAMACAATTVVMKALVFGALSFTGAASWLVACESAVVLTATWSAIARRRAVRHAQPLTAVETWTAPVPGVWSHRPAAVGLITIPVVQHVLLRRVETFDWNFLVQNLCILSAWFLTIVLVHACLRSRLVPGVGRPVAAGALAIIAVAGIGAGGRIEATLPESPQFVPEFVLDAYATVDPSYRLMRQFLATEPPGSREFFRELSANSLIQHVDVKPIEVSFATPLAPAAASQRPHIFLFVIDSLRRDYLSPYNPTVHFTPAIGQFAAESFTFTRAFTRYGGTGLSMPAIWAGSMLLHKEYVQPFYPMNALEKLIDVNGYRSMISMDHITAQIVSPAFRVDELDAGRDEMQYDFCDTLEELQLRLQGGAKGSPVFAHTRSLNLHISKLTTRVGAPEAAFGEFQGPAAAAIQRMDACFGRFISSLKRNGLYEDSIVILTADHGDALGEAHRWGHAYTLFPEIVRTPLLIHLPERLRQQFTADVDAASFSTDITPSLYALLGYPPEPTEWPLGRSLFVRPGTDVSWRRREPALVSSSYGPVYGVLRDNGRSLYIADAVNGRDYAYDLLNLKPVRVGVTPRMRTDGRAFIHARLGALAALYHFTPQP